MKKVITLCFIFLFLLQTTFAQNNKIFQPTDNQEPIGGQPQKGSKVSVPDLEYQVIYQRAFEAVLWSVPAVDAYKFRTGAFENLGITDNNILACSDVAKPNLELLTANSNTPYIAAYTDLRKGAVVLEVPEADASGSLYGQVIDAWQMTIADVGPFGLDKGKQSKYLFTPPNYQGTIPEGYIHVASPNYRIEFAFRSVPEPGKTAADAYNYSKKLKMYYLADAANPPTTIFVDPLKMHYPTLPVYDENYFKDVYDIVTVEPVTDKDKIMVGNLRSLGIERGKPFLPNEKQKLAMRYAAIDAYYYMNEFWENPKPQYYFWKDRNWINAQFTDSSSTFSYEYKNFLDIDGRAAAFYNCTYMPKYIGEKPANWYVVAQGDKNKKSFVAGKSYRLKLPKDIPVKQFWSLTMYDRNTFAFIYTASGRTNLSSFDYPKMRKEADGSVYIYIGPTAPKGWENNWIPTRGKRPFPLMRFYGAEQALHDRSFKLNDFEEIDF